MPVTLREFSQRYPRVYQLLAGYLNADVTSAEEAVNCFAADDPTQSLPTAKQVREFLQSSDDNELEEVLDAIIVGYDFEADDLSARGWLARIASQLEAS